LNRPRKSALGILIVVIAIQFVRPDLNQSDQEQRMAVMTALNMPDSVFSIFRTSCFDCHSNNTSYPWYSYVQPVGWLIEKDITDGKDMLNFSELRSLSPRRQVSKWNNIKNRIQDGTMPLSQYLFMHPEARLSDREKERAVAWIQETIDSLSSRE